MAWKGVQMARTARATSIRPGHILVNINIDSIQDMLHTEALKPGVLPQEIAVSRRGGSSIVLFSELELSKHVDLMPRRQQKVGQLQEPGHFGYTS